LVPINMESMAAPWERSFTNYRRAGLLDEFYNVVLTKNPRNFLTSLQDRFLVCYLVRVTVTHPESSFRGHFPLFRNCRGMRPSVCFYYSLSAFTHRPAGPMIPQIATPLAGPNLFIPKTQSHSATCLRCSLCTKNGFGLTQGRSPLFLVEHKLVMSPNMPWQGM
jgi:hypothetical protein